MAQTIYAIGILNIASELFNEFYDVISTCVKISYKIFTHSFVTDIQLEF